MKLFSPPFAFLAVLASALLSGCATTVTVDSQVQAFSSITALPAPATYKFDRLPSMQEPGQAKVEAMADAALYKAGFQRDDAAARYTVQVTGRIQRVVSPWADPWTGPVFGGFGWGYRRGGRFGYSMDVESPWYHREAAVIIRDLANNKVVFESRSVHDGPWMDNAMVFPAMFEAALQGFPQPPVGPRRVDITVPAVASK